MLGVVKVQWYRGRQWKAPVLYLGNRAGPVSLPREQTVCFRQLGCIKAFLFFCQEHEFQLQSMLEKECVGKVVGREKAASVGCFPGLSCVPHCVILAESLYLRSF
uniref:Uncharacterized protein n=1 Tax=Picea glauca TaxID=3330 RepID=A0A117NIH0_PICGL|nr:hypothetical protein ABT39_MTgene3181 [Picea glauca]QHR89074.1 hypothetical protein Q903MT_gene3093 [Picea sitchensis]